MMYSSLALQLTQCGLVEPLDLAHGGLDVEGLHVLPVLLQQGHQEVHGQVDILGELLLGHLHVAHSNIEAENLLHLELDGGLEVEALCVNVISVGDQGGELAGLRRRVLLKVNIKSQIKFSSYHVESRSKEPGDLLDQGVRAEEGIVGLGQVLHLLLVLVELLEVISGHGRKVLLRSLIAVGLVAQNANPELLAGHILQPGNHFRTSSCLRDTTV